MKLRKLEFKQILKLHLLKHRTYEQSLVKNNNMNLVTDLSLNETVFNLKKALQIIFQYHTKNKRVLFIGLPTKLESKINITTNHVALPQDLNIQGLISNRSNKNLRSVKQTSKQKTVKFKSLLPKLSQKPDLVVVVAHEKVEAIHKECAVAKLPIINFRTEELSKETWSTYSYDLQLSNKNSSLAADKNLFSIGLNFLFKISDIQNRKSFNFKQPAGKKKSNR
uniref:Ribosomal protein S2 n=1 Tax=Cylindrotheca closterium TaxID=2856 RepID=A0A2U9GHH5_9STRA|nr:ribosomal protein S2 [Cylindrotheca closterium]AWQ64037.1 ribosomal protein S2 [Cylindrotheca closterium]